MPNICENSPLDRASLLIECDQDKCNSSSNTACDAPDLKHYPEDKDGYTCKNVPVDGTHCSWVGDTWGQEKARIKECTLDVESPYWNPQDYDTKKKCCLGELNGDQCGDFRQDCTDNCKNLLEQCQPKLGGRCSELCDLPNADVNSDWYDYGCYDNYTDECSTGYDYVRKLGFLALNSIGGEVGTMLEAKTQCSNNDECAGITTARQNEFWGGYQLVKDFDNLVPGDFVSWEKDGTFTQERGKYENLADSKLIKQKVSDIDTAEAECNSDINCSGVSCLDCERKCEDDNKSCGVECDILYAGSQGPLYNCYGVCNSKASSCINDCTPEDNICYFKSGVNKIDTVKWYEGDTYKYACNKECDYDSQKCESYCDSVYPGLGASNTLCKTYVCDHLDIKCRSNCFVEGNTIKPNLEDSYGYTTSTKWDSTNLGNSKIFTSQYCQEFCESSDPQLQKKCYSMKGEYCTKGDNILKDECQSWCIESLSATKNDDKCASHLRKWCGKNDVPHYDKDGVDICSCFKSQPFYDKLYQKYIDLGLGIIPRRPECLYSKCNAAGTWRTQNQLADCGDLLICLNEVIINNDGSIGPVNIDTTNSCPGFKGGCEGDVCDLESQVCDGKLGYCVTNECVLCDDGYQCNKITNKCEPSGCPTPCESGYECNTTSKECEIVCESECDVGEQCQKVGKATDCYPKCDLTKEIYNTETDVCDLINGGGGGGETPVEEDEGLADEIIVLIVVGSVIVVILIIWFILSYRTEGGAVGRAVGRARAGRAVGRARAGRSAGRARAGRSAGRARR